MPTTLDGAALSVGRARSQCFADVPTRREDVSVGAFELEIGQRCDAEVVARMTLTGAPDAGCAEEIAEILALIEGNVHIDLRACEQLDRVIVATLARAFQELGSRGHDLEVIVSPRAFDGVRGLARSGNPRASLRIDT